MQISPKTFSLLKNCAMINTGLVIKPGNKLVAISEYKDILLQATIEETFPKSASIYDLNQFLATLSLMNNQEIEFKEKSMIITSSENSIEYFYAGEGIVIMDDKWWNPVKDPDAIFEFPLLSEDLTLIQKTSALFNSPNLSIIGDGENVTLIIGNNAVASNNNYKKTLGKSSEKFKYVLEMRTLKVIPDHYTVLLPKGKRRLYFRGQNYDTQYWLACTDESEV